MATSSTKETRLSGMLVCALCSKKKSGRNPKLLQCFHSFCQSCLVSQRKKQTVKSELRCPVCNSATKVAGAGVKGLKDEQKITALEDMMKRFGGRLVCQGCLPKGLPSVAVVKCITCDRYLCEVCYEFHSSSDLFEGHDVATELCELHGNKVRNICVTCCVGLCVDCIFSRIHEEHEMAKVEDGLSKVESQIEDDRKCLQSLHERTAAKGLIIDRKQDDLEKNIKCIPSSAQLSRMIGKTENYTIGRVTKLSHRKSELRRNIIRMKEILREAPSEKSCNLINRSVFNWSGRKITHGPSLVYEKRSKEIFGLEILDDFSALVASEESDTVVRYNTDGKVMGFYRATGSKPNKVQLITVQDGNLHVLYGDNKTLETINIDTFQKEARTIINLPGDLCSMAYHPENKSFLFSQHPGVKTSRVYMCHEGETEVDESSLPSGFLKVFKHDGSIKTASARLANGNVKVYDSESSLLYTIPNEKLASHFSEPGDVAPLDQTSILVADRERCCISQFIKNEAVLFDVSLSREGGLSTPCHIACKYPYLWVACITKLCLFKWQ